MIILDTDHCIEILRGNKKVIEARKKRAEAVSVTWMTAGELFYGAARSSAQEENASLVEAFLLTVDVRFPTMRSMRLFGELKARLAQGGTGLADADVLIGAAAIEGGAVLVTGNTRHFERIPGLTLENWTR